jgi:hypothetical protein
VVSFTPLPLYPRERAPDTHFIGGWVDPRAGLDDMEKWKFFTLPGLELLLPLVVQPVASRYTDWAIPAPLEVGSDSKIWSWFPLDSEPKDHCAGEIKQQQSEPSRQLRAEQSHSPVEGEWPVVVRSHHSSKRWPHFKVCKSVERLCWRGPATIQWTKFRVLGVHTDPNANSGCRSARNTRLARYGLQRFDLVSGRPAYYYDSYPLKDL